jgi:hypothetical protein
LRDEAPADAQTLIDVAHIIAIWSPFLVPLPFAETVVSRTWPDAVNDGPPVVAFPPGWRDTPNASSVDHFAPSLPIGPDTGGVGVDSRRLAVVRAAAGVACAELVFAQTRSYSATRVAYGKPIGANQALKHLMADMHVQLELSASAVVWAANDLQRSVEIARDALSRCQWVLGRCIQIYGGIGYTWEAGVHFHSRHVMAMDKLVRLEASAVDRVGA